MAEENKKEKGDASREDAENADFEGEEGDGQKGLNKKKIIMIAVPVAVVLLLASILFLSGVLDGLFASGEEPKAEAPAAAAGGEAAAEQGKAAKTPAAAGGAPAISPEPQSIFFDLPDMLVNLNSGTKKQVYLKVSVSLDLPDEATKARVERVLPRVVDSFQVYLRELSLAEVQGSVGMYRLKEELVERINRIISPSKINDVLFKEMLVQ